MLGIAVARVIIAEVLAAGGAAQMKPLSVVVLERAAMSSPSSAPMAPRPGGSRSPGPGRMAR